MWCVCVLVYVMFVVVPVIFRVALLRASLISGKRLEEPFTNTVDHWDLLSKVEFYYFIK